MRLFPGFAIIILTLFSCDEHRVYEMNSDFHSRYWPAAERPVFEFDITDTLSTYNLYANVRNSLDYPFANIFLTFYLHDSTGRQMEKDLVRQLLFDEKTGEPVGESGLGDIYDHRIALRTNHRFSYAGKYKVAFEHYMRTDTLSGILAIGLRVEKSPNPNP